MKTVLILLIVVFIFFFSIWFSTYHPKPIEPVDVNGIATGPSLQPGQKIKIMSWNIQFMAGKNYTFFFDLIDHSGPDISPTAADVNKTLAAVAEIIAEEQPDIILLQELDDGAKRTGHEDQLAQLMKLLSKQFTCQADAFYWKAAYVPKSKIMGSAGLKLGTISKYPITSASRHQLPIMPENWLIRQFSLKRAILETRIPMQNGDELIIMNTHLEAFAQGYDTMQQQVHYIENLLGLFDRDKKPWLIAGDFNLLPNQDGYDRLPPHQQLYFSPETELKTLLKKYPSTPSLADMNSSDCSRWYTHFSNDPRVKGPDRTIDYIFGSHNLRMTSRKVRHEGTLAISDHLPVIVEITVPEVGK